MRAALYTTDLLPITVIEIGPYLERLLRKGDFVQMAVAEMPPMDWSELEKNRAEVRISTVRIWAECVRRGNRELLMLFTNDEEAALALRPEYLPGQLHDLRDQRKAAFAHGFLHAIGGFG